MRLFMMKYAAIGRTVDDAFKSCFKRAWKVSRLTLVRGEPLPLLNNEERGRF